MSAVPEHASFVHVGDLAKWPAFLPQIGDAALLDHIWVQVLETDANPQRVAVSTRVLVDREIVLSIPGLDAVQLTVAAQDGGTVLPLDIEVYPSLHVQMRDVPLSLRLKSDLFRPVRPVGPVPPGGVPQFEADPERDHLDIVLARVTLEADGDGGIAIAVDGGIDLPPCMLGDSGIVIEAQGLALHLDGDAPPAGQPAGWRGIHLASASLYLPGELAGIAGTLTLTDCYIGNGGFTGAVQADWNPPLAASLFGTEFRLKRLSLSFVQNSLTAGAIVGDITLPFFDAPLEIEICPNMNGPFLVRLTTAGGIARLTRPGVLDLTVETLGFAIDGRRFTVTLSGSIRPLLGGLDWPAFAVRELAIDSDGNVRLEGGWLDLPSQYTLDFHGFSFEITKLGFGNTEDGGRWLGCSGTLKLVDGLAAGASVEGLRVSWYADGREPSVRFDGVGVEFEVAGALRFKGAVSYRELEVAGETVHRFDGRIKAELLALDMSLDATLVLGSAAGPAGDYTFMAVYLDAELPAGIPLWTTGLALYGVAGLFASNMEPDKRPDEEWYGIGADDGWYHRGEDGVTDLRAKWVNRRGSLALGAGITLGTVPDNGFIFSGKMLLVIVFPGPILMIEGKANVLRERSSLDEEATFRALAVIDKRAGTLTLGLDARYAYGPGGELIEIAAGVEAFFSFSDADAWHIYLGEREPREKRVRAEFFQFLEVNGYFMLDTRQVAMGAWVGYDRTWKFGPLAVTLEAWLEGNAVVSRKPVHLTGDLWLHGKAGLKVFGFGLSLSVDARFAAEVFDPFHLLATFSVGINLPWPLPDFDADIKLEWGPEPTRPPLPMPLKEIAIEHFKVTESWPLPRGGAGALLLPNYDTDGDGFRADPQPAVAVQRPLPPPAHAPVVPLDARPHITFGRAVHDAALVGINAQPVVPATERIGDPALNQGPTAAKFILSEVALEAWRNGAWTAVARKGTTPNAPDVETLYGSWAAVPAMPDGNGQNVAQVKLWLWSRSGFDYTRHSGRAWDDWFTGRFDDYPCPPPPRERTVCLDFQAVGPLAPLVSPLTLPRVPEITLAWIYPAVHRVTILPVPLDGRTHALCMDQDPASHNEGIAILGMTFSQPVSVVRMRVSHDPAAPGTLSAVGHDANGQTVATATAAGDTVVLAGAGMARAALYRRGRFCVTEICITIPVSREAQAAYEDMVQHLRDELATWSQKGAVLAPHTSYRLTVATRIETTDDPIGDHDHVEFAYFRTEGPPGLAALSAPAGGGDTPSALRDLARYVAQTVPPTVAPPGSPPLLPRPVYRGYDVGVSFNEDYVDLMYRASLRDLGLYLFDNNRQPVRDPSGRLPSTANRWGQSDVLTLTGTDTRWLTAIDQSSCATLGVLAIPRPVALSAADDGLVLEADTLYEACLIPLLLHDTFDAYAAGAVAAGTGATLGRWRVVDQGGTGPASHWEIREAGTPPARHVAQTSNTWGGSTAAGDAAKPGTLLVLSVDPALPVTHPDQPGAWTDYRLHAYIRSEDDDAVGLAFRYTDEHNHYRYAMDRERRYRRLVRVRNGIATVLAEDGHVYQSNRDYLVSVEAIGDQLRVYQDREPVFAVRDAALATGGIALYCWANAGARFADVRVDDLRREAPIPYRFQFTTSRFVNVAHHLHSYQDEAWHGVLASNQAYATWRASAVGPLAGAPDSYPTPIAEGEARAYAQLAQALAPSATPAPSALRVTRVTGPAGVLGYLVESPEPLDWQRIALGVGRAASTTRPAVAPGSVKLTRLQHAAAGAAGHESVTLLAREPQRVDGWLVEHYGIPGPLTIVDEGAVRWQADFATPARPATDADGVRRVGGWIIADAAASGAPSAWHIDDGALCQVSPIGDAAQPLAAGTLAIAPADAMDDARVSVRVRADTTGALGIVLRRQPNGDGYRYAVSHAPAYRRLTRHVGATTTVLWQDAGTYVPGASTTWTFDLLGTRIVAYQDGDRLFSVQDEAFAAGGLALYAWRNTGARFQDLAVRQLPLGAYAWFEDRFAAGDLSAWTFVDEGAQAGPSSWAIADGALRQSAEIFSPPIDRDTLDKPGALALAGDVQWRDYIVDVALSSIDDDAVGVVFRHADATHFYRFSMDSQRGYRRLVKNVGGTWSLLWEDDVPYQPGRTYRLCIVAEGSVLRGYLDDVPLFIVDDGDIPSGRIGLYTWGNYDARFSRVAVYPATLATHRHLLDDPLYLEVMGRWTIFDPAVNERPSAWAVDDGWMTQSSRIGDADGPRDTGTYAVAGAAAWRDYRVTVRLRSDDDGAIGLMLRYRDANHYLRFSMDRTGGYRRLVRCADGETTVLWEDQQAYEPGRPYLLTVDAIGSRIRGYIDAVRLFDVDIDIGDDGGGGRIALYSARNAGARFSELRVTAAAWLAYYQFGSGEMMMPGEPWQVFSASPVEAPAPDGTTARYRDPLAARGVPRLGADPVSLRLGPPGARIAHQRGFLPDDAYTDEPCAVLRQADGAAFFLLPAAPGPDAPVDAGDRRLRFTYRRDNTARVPTSQILRAGGRTDPETAWLDIPWDTR